MFNKALETKIYNIENYGVYTHKLYDTLFFNKIKGIFGGDVRFMITGSAALDPKIMMFFRASLGFAITEGYGQTEMFAAGCSTHV